MVLAVDDLMDEHYVLQGSPGYVNEAVVPGDKLLRVDGKGVETCNVKFLHDLLSGDMHSLVELVFSRGGRGEKYSVRVRRHGFHEHERRPEEPKDHGEEPPTKQSLALLPSSSSPSSAASVEDEILALRLRVKQLESEKMAANQDSRLLQSEQENVKARQECEDMRKRLEMLKQAVREERQRAQETTPQASAVVSDELIRQLRRDLLQSQEDNRTLQLEMTGLKSLQAAKQSDNRDGQAARQTAALDVALDLATARAEEAETALQRAEKQAKEASVQLIQMQKELELSTQENQELQSRITASDAERAVTMTALQEQMAIVARLEEQLAILGLERSISIESSETAQDSELYKTKSECEKLRAQLLATEADFKQHDAALDNCMSYVAKSEAVLRTAQMQALRHAAEQSQQHGELNNIQLQLNRSKIDLDHCKADLLRSQEQLQRKEGELLALENSSTDRIRKLEQEKNDQSEARESNGKQVEKLLAQFNAQKIELDDINCEKQSLIEQLFALRKNTDTMQTTLKNQLDSAISVKEKAEEELKNAQSSWNVSLDRMKSLEQEKDSWEAALDNLKSELDKSRAEKIDLATKLSSWESNSLNERQERAKHDARVTQEQQRAFEREQERAQEAEDSLKRAENDAEQLRDSLSHAEELISSLQNEVEELSNQRNTLTAKLSSTEADRLELQERLSTIGSSQDSAARALQEMLSRESSRAYLAEERFASIEKELAQERVRANEAEEKARDIVLASSSNIGRADADRKLAAQRIEALEKQLDTQTGQNNKAQASIKDLMDEMQHLADNLAGETDRSGQLSSDLQAMSQEAQKQKTQIQDLEEKLLRLQTEAKVLTNERKSLSEKRLALEEEAQNYVTIIVDLENKLSDVGTNLDAVTNERNKLVTELNEWEGFSSSLRSERDSLAEKLKLATAETKAESDKVMLIQQVLKQKTDEISALDAKYNEAVSALGQKMLAQTKRADEAMASLRQETEKLESLQTQNTEMMSKLSAGEQELADVISRSSATQQDAERLTKELGKLKTEMDESEAKFQEASRVYNQKIDNLKKELSELAEASAARANSLESQLQALKIELENAKLLSEERNRMLDAANETHRESMSAASNELDKRSKEMAILSGQLEKDAERERTRASNAESSVESMRLQMTEMRSKQGALEQELADAMAEITRATDRAQKAEAYARQADSDKIRERKEAERERTSLLDSLAATAQIQESTVKDVSAKWAAEKERADTAVQVAETTAARQLDLQQKFDEANIKLEHAMNSMKELEEANVSTKEEAETFLGRAQRAEGDLGKAEEIMRDLMQENTKLHDDLSQQDAIFDELVQSKAKIQSLEDEIRRMPLPDPLQRADVMPTNSADDLKQEQHHADSRASDRSSGSSIGGEQYNADVHDLRTRLVVTRYRCFSKLLLLQSLLPQVSTKSVESAETFEQQQDKPCKILEEVDGVAGPSNIPPRLIQTSTQDSGTHEATSQIQQSMTKSATVGPKSFEELSLLQTLSLNEADPRVSAEQSICSVLPEENGILNRNLAESRAQTLELQSAVESLKAEHKRCTEELRSRLDGLDHQVISYHKMDKMKSILEKAERDLDDRARQYLEQDRLSPNSVFENSLSSSPEKSRAGSPARVFSSPVRTEATVADAAAGKRFTFMYNEIIDITMNVELALSELSRAVRLKTITKAVSGVAAEAPVQRNSKGLERTTSDASARGPVAQPDYSQALETLTERLAEAEGQIQKDNAALIKNNSEHEQKMSQKNAEIEELKLAIEIQTRELRLQDADDVLMELQEMLTVRGVELKSLEATEQAHFHRIQQLENENMALKNACKEVIDGDLQSSISALRIENEALSAELASSRAKNKELELNFEKLECAHSHDAVKMVLYRQNEEQYKRDLRKMQEAAAAFEANEFDAFLCMVDSHGSGATNFGQSSGLSVQESVQRLAPFNEVMTSLEIASREIRMKMIQVQDRFNALSAQGIHGETYRRPSVQGLKKQDQILNQTSPSKSVEHVTCLAYPCRTNDNSFDDNVLTQSSEYAYMRAYSRLFSAERKAPEVEADPKSQYGSTETDLNVKTKCDLLAKTISSSEETARAMAEDCHEMQKFLSDVTENDWEQSCSDCNSSVPSDAREAEHMVFDARRLNRRSGHLRSNSVELGRMLAEAKILVNQISRAESSMEAQLIRLATKNAVTEQGMREMCSSSQALEATLSTEITHVESVLSRLRRTQYSQQLVQELQRSQQHLNDKQCIIDELQKGLLARTVECQRLKKAEAEQQAQCVTMSIDLTRQKLEKKQVEMSKWVTTLMKNLSKANAFALMSSAVYKLRAHRQIVEKTLGGWNSQAMSKAMQSWVHLLHDKKREKRQNEIQQELDACMEALKGSQLRARELEEETSMLKTHASARAVVSFQLEQQLTASKEHVQEMKQENIEMARKMAEIQVAHAGEAQKLRALVQELQDDVVHMQLQMSYPSRIEDELSALGRGIVDRDAKIEELTDEASANKQKAETQLEDLEQMQVMLNTALSGVEGGVEGMMRKASEEVSSLRAAYQDEVREREQQLEEAQQTILELRGESAESQQRLLQSREDIESLQAENERLRLQCNRVGEGEVLSNDAASLPSESPASERVVRKWTCDWQATLEDKLSALGKVIADKDARINVLEDECAKLIHVGQDALNLTVGPSQHDHFSPLFQKYIQEISLLKEELLESEAAREQGMRQIAQMEFEMHGLTQDLAGLKDAHTIESAKVQSGDDVVQKSLPASIPLSKDLILLLRKMRSDLDESMQDQVQLRSVNKSREAELRSLKQQSSILCDQLQALSHGSVGGLSPFAPRSPAGTARESTTTPRAK